MKIRRVITVFEKFGDSRVCDKNLSAQQFKLLCELLELRHNDPVFDSHQVTTEILEKIGILKNLPAGDYEYFLESEKID